MEVYERIAALFGCPVGFVSGLSRADANQLLEILERLESKGRLVRGAEAEAYCRALALANATEGQRACLN